MTKDEPKCSLLFTMPVYLTAILAAIILLSFRKWSYAVIVLIPLVFLYPIWMTFIQSRDYQGKKKFPYYGYILLRYLLVLLCVLIPALLYYYIPFFSDNLTGFSLLISPSEVLILYRLIIPETLLIERKREKR